MGIQWHEIFDTGIIPDDIIEDEARAIAYSAWGNCHAKAEIPEHFGKVMAELAIRFKSVADINCGKG